MILRMPLYCKDFTCTAEKCGDNCCIGWEIDIDPDTAELYQSLPDPLGEQLRSNIITSPEGDSFRLTADERCPMLNGDGLCELLLHNGGDTDVLCDVCDNHPEFHNFSFARSISFIFHIPNMIFLYQSQCIH